MSKRRWLTPSQFAREAGVTPAEITQSVKRGRIAMVIRDGKKRIDLKTQLKRFMATVKHAGHMKSSAADQAPKSGAKVRGSGKKGNGKPPKSTPTPKPKPDFILQAREVQERYKAIDVALAHEERVGNLVKLDEVALEFKEIAAKVKRAILNIPDRLAPLIAAEKTRKRCHEILDRECRTILEDIADAIRNSKHQRRT